MCNLQQGKCNGASPDQCSPDKRPTFPHHFLLFISIDQLDKTDAPLIPEAYIHLLGTQYPVSFSNGLWGKLFLYNNRSPKNHARVKTEPLRALGQRRPGHKLSSRR